MQPWIKIRYFTSQIAEIILMLINWLESIFIYKERENIPIDLKHKLEVKNPSISFGTIAAALLLMISWKLTLCQLLHGLILRGLQ